MAEGSRMRMEKRIDRGKAWRELDAEQTMKAGCGREGKNETWLKGRHVGGVERTEQEAG